MAIVTIVYFSGAGATATFAASIAAGAKAVAGTEVHLLALDANDIVQGRYRNADLISQLDASDALIFGSPTYMAGCAAQFKAFADATVGTWAGQKWRDKLAAGFTVSGTPSGDKLSTLQYLQAFAMQHGMVWIGTGELPMQPNGLNRLGSWLGAMAQSEPDKPQPIVPADQRSGEAFGQRVAAFAVAQAR